MASICSCVAPSPASTLAGSAGMMWLTEKTMSSRPTSVGTNHAKRFRTRAKMRMLRVCLWPTGKNQRRRLDGAAASRKRQSSVLHGGPPHLLTVADRAEADIGDLLVERAEPLRIVDEDSGRILH